MHRPRAVCMLAARAWRVPFPRSRRQSNAPEPKFVVVCLVTRNLHDVHGTAFILCDRTLRSSSGAEVRAWSGIAGTGRSEARAGKRTGRVRKRRRGSGYGPKTPSHQTRLNLAARRRTHFVPAQSGNRGCAEDRFGSAGEGCSARLLAPRSPQRLPFHDAPRRTCASMDRNANGRGAESRAGSLLLSLFHDGDLGVPALIAGAVSLHRARRRPWIRKSRLVSRRVSRVSRVSGFLC